MQLLSRILEHLLYITTTISTILLQNEVLEEVQHLFRSVNNDVAFLLAEQGQIKR